MKNNLLSKIGRGIALTLGGASGLVATAKAPAESLEYWDNLRTQPFLERKILDFDNKPYFSLTQFRDTENKGRGFTVYQMYNSQGQLVELYDFEKDGSLLDSSNPDRDNTIDNVVVTDIRAGEIYREEEKESESGRELYREATKKFVGALKPTVEERTNTQSSGKGVLD